MTLRTAAKLVIRESPHRSGEKALTHCFYGTFLLLLLLLLLYAPNTVTTQILFTLASPSSTTSEVKVGCFFFIDTSEFTLFGPVFIGSWGPRIMKLTQQTNDPVNIQIKSQKPKQPNDRGLLWFCSRNSGAFKILLNFNVAVMDELHSGFHLLFLFFVPSRENIYSLFFVFFVILVILVRLSTAQ